MANNFWEYYDLFDKNQYIDTKRTDNEINFIKKYLPLNKYKKIIDVACGTGRIAIPLSKSGYTLLGIDNNKDFINQAKKEALNNFTNINFINSDYRDLPDILEFDAAIFIYSSFGYFSDRENIKLLRSINTRLRDNGLIILDNLNYYWAKNKPEGFWKDLTTRFEDNFLKLHNFSQIKRLRLITEDDKYEKTTYKVRYNSGKIQTASFKQRLFNKQDMDNFLKKSGFKTLNIFGDFEMSTYTKKSPRIIVIAKKIK